MFACLLPAPFQLPELSAKVPDQVTLLFSAFESGIRFCVHDTIGRGALSISANPQKAGAAPENFVVYDSKSFFRFSAAALSSFLL